MLEIIKSFFSPVGGGRTSFASQNGNIQRKEDLRQGRNLVSNSDFNRKRGEEYLISSSFASENIVGGGQLRSNNYSASSRSYKGGEGNYASLMSSDFAGAETMLNPGNASFWNVDVSSRSDRRVGGGEIHWKRQLLECKQSLCSWIRLQRKDATKVASHLFKKRKGASRLVGRGLTTSRACSLLMDASRMTSVLIHEMISLSRKEVQA